MRTERDSNTTLAYIYVLALAALAVAFRAAPYYLYDGERHFFWHLLPVGALALFAGSRLRTAWAWLVPLGVMLASDLLIAYPVWKMGYPPFSLIRTPVIYASFAAYVALGRLIRRGDLSVPVIGGAALLAGVQFFVLTNFASWVVDITSVDKNWYAPTLAGLGDCFLAGLPFYKNTLAGDLVYSAVIFGGFALLTRAVRSATPALIRADEVRR